MAAAPLAGYLIERLHAGFCWGAGNGDNGACCLRWSYVASLLRSEYYLADDPRRLACSSRRIITPLSPARA